MDTINAITSAIGGALMSPFESLPPLFTLAFWSLVMGVVGMVVYRYTSNQDALKATNDRMKANLLAMRMFKDEIGVTLSSQLELMKVAALKFFYAIVPILVMIVPFVLGMAQIGTYFENRPLKIDEPAVVTLKLNNAITEDEWPTFKNIRLDAPEGVEIETPHPVRDFENRSIRWRVHATKAGTQELSWNVAGDTVTKTITAGGGLRRVSPLRPNTEFWDQLLYPTERAFSAESNVQSISINYPLRETWPTHWLVTLLILSIVLGYIATKPFIKIQI